PGPGAAGRAGRPSGQRRPPAPARRDPEDRLDEHLRLRPAQGPGPQHRAGGPCRQCKEGNTGVCLTTNPDRPGSAYGYVDMGGWVGGQAEYVTVPYADFNLLAFPDKAQAMEKIRDLTCLTDILPTGYHGCVTAGVTTGSTVLIAGAGPVGLSAAASAQLLGAAVVIITDLNRERLARARSIGCETIDPS